MIQSKKKKKKLQTTKPEFVIATGSLTVFYGVAR